MPVEPLPTAPFTAAAAAADRRVPDPARGGPPVRPGASPLPPFWGVSRATATYVGPATCAACHPAAAAIWSGTGHAHALATLTAVQSSFNPSCLPCHVTGFGHPGGWAGVGSGPLQDVSCEACHGPGSDHIAVPVPSNTSLPRFGALPPDSSACVACHTHDTSPDFQFAAYWLRIAHGAGG